MCTLSLGKTKPMCRTYSNPEMLTGETELYCICHMVTFLMVSSALSFLFLPACHQSCLRCAGKSPHNCTACWPSQVLLDGQCLSECPDSYFNQEGSCTGEYVTCWGMFPTPLFRLCHAARLCN